MADDPIVAEVRRIREEHAAKYGYDLEKIFVSLKEREKQSKRKFSSYPPRSPRPATVGARHGERPNE